MKHMQPIQKIVLGVMTTFMALFPFLVHKGLIYAGTPIKVFTFFIVAEFLFFIFLWFYIRRESPALAFHPIIIALGLFILGMTVSALMGSNVNRSFWSMFNRFTGLITWYHLFALALVLTSTLTTKSLWRTLFLTLGLSGGVLAILLMLGADGFGLVQYSSSGGATLWNSTYAGTYMFFTAFFSLWTLCTTKIKWQRVLSTIAFALILINPMFLDYGFLTGNFSLIEGLRDPVLLLGEARMAAFVTVIGLITSFLIFQAIQARRVIFRRISAGLLAIGIVCIAALSAFLFLDTPVREAFVDLNGGNRLIYWDIALEGAQERPFLGWGPENYAHMYTEHLQPKQFAGPTVIEPWADKPHSMPLEILATAGVWNTVLYFAIFLVPLIAIRLAIRKRRIEAIDAAIFGAIVPMYFLNVLIFFFMPQALLLFTITLSFIAVTTSGALRVPTLAMPEITPARRTLASLVILALFVTSIIVFAFVPWHKARALVHVATKAPGEERYLYVSRTLANSPQSRAYSARTLSFNLAQGISGSLESIRQNPDSAILDIAALKPETREVLTEVAPENDKLRWVYTFLIYTEWQIAPEGTVAKRMAAAEMEAQADLLINQTRHPYAYITGVEVLKDYKPEKAYDYLLEGLALYPDNEILNSFLTELEAEL